MTAKRFKTGRILWWAALLSLGGAYVMGWILKNQEIQQTLEARIPEGQVVKKTAENPPVFEVRDAEEAASSGYYVVTKAQGWGGPLIVAVQTDNAGIIQTVMVLDHKETPSFFNRLQKKQYFDQYLNKHVGDPIFPGRDIDTITQATVSSKAFAEAIRAGVHSLGRRVFNLEIREIKPQWEFGYQEILLIGLFAAAYIACLFSLNILRFAVMTVSFVLLGFMLNASLSVAQFGSLALGFFPPFLENTFWWILISGAVLFVLLTKKNLYCYALCPFGNLQELNSRISGINLNLHSKISHYAPRLGRVLAWLALMIIFIRQTPALGAYEPFPTLFGLEGIEIQWVILPLVILGSFVLKRYFCRFFCPVGVILNLCLKLRGSVSKKYSEAAACKNGK